MTTSALIPQTIPLLPCLPAGQRRRIAGRSVNFRIPQQVRLRMRQPEKIRVSDAAARFRIVTGVDAKPGPWRNDLVPHAVEIMDLYAQPWLKELWICWPERAAKTNLMLNCLAWAVRSRPGNIFWLDPAETDSGNNVKTKIIPMFRESPRLRQYLSPKADDTGKQLIAFAHGMYLFPAHANSARTMANFFGLHNFGNEVDKYPPMVGEEADPINLLRKRGRDVPGSKFIFSSTPAGRFIYKGTMACRQVRQFENRCPHCGEYVLMDDDHLVVPQDATSDQVKSGEVPVYYACNACAAEWDEADRAESYRLGRWRITKGADAKRPRTIGAHMSALCLPMIPLAEYAEKYLAAKAGDLAAKRDYAHGYQVKDYETEKSDRKEDAILALVDETLPRGVVPPDTSTIIVEADTQRLGYYYQVYACGYLTAGQVPIAMIDHGFVENEEGLKEIESREYQDAAGGKYLPHAGVIDSGGGTNPYKPKHTRTAEVYEFCRANKFWRPVKGRRDQATPWSVTRLDYFPSRDGKKRPIPGGLNLYTLNVTHYKNQLASRLNINPGDPGAIRLHAGVNQDGPHSGQKYAAQLCAEYQDERGYWECPNNKANHFWDCHVYGFAAIDILGVRRKQKPVTDQPAARQRRIYSEGVSK